MSFLRFACGVGFGAGLVSSACGLDDTCPIGTQGCACTENGACNPGLSCEAADQICLSDSEASHGDSDTDPGGQVSRGGNNTDIGDGLIVFTTRTAYRGDLGGLDGADELCNIAAAAAGLGGTFVAWLSTDTVDAIDRIEGDGPWVRLDGTRVFNNRANLATLPLEHLGVDENGSGVEGFVWTGTENGGRAAADANCQGWTSAAAFAVGRGGQTDGEGVDDPTVPTISTDRWTAGSGGECERQGHLYCFEV